MDRNEIIEFELKNVSRWFFVAALTAWYLVTCQVALAQVQLPVLKVIESKKIDRMDGVLGTTNLEIVLSLTNVTQQNATVFGRKFEGEFCPIDAKYVVKPNERKIVYADDHKVVLKVDGRAFTASRVLKPGESFTYSIFLNGGPSSCLEGLVAVAWARTGRERKTKQISSEPLMPCSKQLL